MSADGKPIRQMPKGGRKGGAVFPRIALKDAIVYAKKLVSKTHVNPQPQDVIYSGVVGAKSGIGNIRISALRQFGFLKGDNKSNYSADELAKRIDAAPEEELLELYRQSVIKPVIFKGLFDTFQGDAVTKAKLKQRAADLKVHPDETETCVEIYVSSLLTAGLVESDGDRITHLLSSQLSTELGASKERNSDAHGEPEAGSSDFENRGSANGEEEDKVELDGVEATPSEDPRSLKDGPRAVFNVNITLDSSMDIEKLHKQLELLKRFGAI